MVDVHDACEAPRLVDLVPNPILAGVEGQEPAGQLPGYLMTDIDAGVRLVLDL